METAATKPYINENPTDCDPEVEPNIDSIIGNQWEEF